MLAAGAALGALALGVSAAALWTQRSALGAKLVVHALARRGVAARVRITRIDAAGAEGSLSAGPAGDPDLVVPHLRVSFAAWPPPDGGAPRVTAVALDHARLKARWDGRRLTFGALQPLVDDALRARPGGAPSPDVQVRDGTLELATAGGLAHVAGDLRLRAGRLASARLAVAAESVAERGVTVQHLVGRIGAAADGDRLNLHAHLSAAATQQATKRLRVRSPSLQLDADLPYGRDAQSLLDGRVTAGAVLLAAGLETPGVRLAHMRLDGRFAGVLDRGGEHAVGDADLTLAAADMAGASAALRGVRAHVTAKGMDAATTRGAPVARAPLSLDLAAQSGEARLAGERLRIDGVRIAGRGRALLRDGLHARGEFDASVRGGLDRAAAAGLASAVAPAGWNDLRAALARNFTSAALEAPHVSAASEGRDWRIGLAAPATLATAAGARMTLAQAAWAGSAKRGRGRLAATLGGGGLPQVRIAAPAIEAAGDVVRARGAGLDLAGSAGPLRNARFALTGDFEAQDRRFALRASRCTELTLGAYLGDEGAPLAQDVAARLCPTPAPLIQAGPEGWRVAARAPSASAQAPAAKLAVTSAAGEVRLAGSLRGWSGEVRLASAHLRDTATPLRFAPLTADGELRLSQHGVGADLAIALAHPARPLGPLHLVQDFTAGEGSLTLDAPALAFAPDGLQPAMVLPALAPFGTEVRGAASATLHLAWGKAGATGDARFRTTGLDLKSAAGPVKGLATDLAIASLDPLTTAPGQRVSAKTLQTLLPLTDIDAVVQLTPSAIELASVQAMLGDGRVSLDPMRVPLQPGATLEGVARARGVHLAPLLDAVNLSRALKLQATLDGVLPFSLGPQGLRFTKGELAATGPGRLTLVRSALTGVAAGGGPAGAPPSAAQDFAFQALEDLAFSALDARVDSQPGGRLGVLFHIKGRHDPPVGRSARVGLLDLLRGRAFEKEIPLPKGTEVDLTLDTSLNFDELYKAYLGLGHAPAAAAAGSAKVQP